MQIVDSRGPTSHSPQLSLRRSTQEIAIQPATPPSLRCMRETSLPGWDFHTRNVNLHTWRGWCMTSARSDFRRGSWRSPAPSRWRSDARWSFTRKLASGSLRTSRITQRSRASFATTTNASTVLGIPMGCAAKPFPSSPGSSPWPMLITR